MHVRSIFLVATYTLAATSPVVAQQLPAWKFAKGQTFEAERVVSQVQTVELKGKSIKQERHSTWRIRLDVKDKVDGEFVIGATLSEVSHKVVGADKSDLLDPKLPEKMKGSAFTLRVSPHGQLNEVKGYDEFIKRIAADDKAQRSAARITFPEAALKEAFADLFGPLPIKEPNWQREYVEQIPNFGALNSTARYQHKGTIKGRDLVEYTIATKYIAPKEDLMVLFRIIEGEVETEKAHGTIAFDAKAGRMLSHERTVRIHGTLTVEVMDRKHKMPFSSDTQVKVSLK